MSQCSLRYEYFVNVIFFDIIDLSFVDVNSNNSIASKVSHQPRQLYLNKYWDIINMASNLTY